MNKEKVIAISPNGQKKWGLHLPEGVLSLAVSKDGTLYVKAKNKGYGNGAALYAVTPNGEIKWKVQQEDTGEVVPII